MIENSVSGRLWTFIKDPDNRITDHIIQQHDVPDLVAKLMAARNVPVDHVGHFLNPRLRDYIPDPSTLPDMQAGVERITDEIDSGRPITIYGDYDVDGATSTAILVRFLRQLGVDTEIYIPDRVEEGYGPNKQALDQIKRRGSNLVIFVDCATTAFEALRHGKSIGLDHVIIDHHKGEAEHPPADAIINPNRLDYDGGFGNLAAVGVTFITVIGLSRHLRNTGWYSDNNVKEPDLMRFLDLVTLGTICDVVPLKGINRALVAQGLKLMNRGMLSPGVAALIEVTGCSSPYSTYHAGFILGPRINAGGRVGKSETGARLLSSDQPMECQRLAMELDQYNVKRKEIEKQALNEAMEDIVTSGAHERSVIVTSGKGWHPGVVGIVAGRISDRFNKPTCVIAIQGDGTGQASCRSVPGMDIGSAVIAAKQSGLLLSGGGHEMAAGFRVEGDKIYDLTDFLCQRISQSDQLDDEQRRVLKLDGQINIGAINLRLAKTIARVAPYGQDNPEPRFAVMDAVIGKSEVVGKNHVKCYITDSMKSAHVKGIAFRVAERPVGKALLECTHKPLHLAGKLRLNHWRGKTSAELQIEDVALAWD